MNSFGFKYSVAKKTYYVDGHEKPETVAYRKQYVTQYIQDELRYFRWIQLTSEEVAKIEKENVNFCERMHLFTKIKKPNLPCMSSMLMT